MIHSRGSFLELVHRNLSALADTTVDLLVIGGGITGCCVARDAARRGLSVALVERRDFSGGTSASTSKLIHGGLRYLRELQVGVVRESLRERRTWQQIAPHVVAPMLFVLPTRTLANRVVMRLGLRVYDTLAWDRDRNLPTEQRIAPHVAYTRTHAEELAPVLRGVADAGGLAYGDAHSLAPERLAIECLLDATAHGATVANYVEATGLTAGTPHVVTVRDTLDGSTFDIRARTVLNAGGPWADRIGKQLGLARPPKLTRSKGIHLITRVISPVVALLVPVRDRHFFVIPWRGHSLIGTTDTPYAGDPDAVGVSEEDIHEFLATINEGLPAADLTRADVRMAYAGLRPLVGSSGATYKASRRSGITVHSPGLLSAIGGKWTTSRALAESCVDRVVTHLGARARSCDTGLVPLPGAGSARRPGRETPDGILRPFGQLADTMMSSLSVPQRITQYAVTHEMAMSLSDVVFRRSGLGTLGPLPEETLRELGSVMAASLDWSMQEQDRQVAAVAAQYRHVSMLP